MVVAVRASRGRLVRVVIGSIALVAMAGCTGSTNGDDEHSTAQWCVRASALLEVVDGLKHRSALPTPADLNEDIAVARRLVGEIESVVPESLSGDVSSLEDAIEVYSEAVEQAGFDLLAAQTQFSTEEQVALYALERNGVDDAITRIDDSLAACP
ncbi:MAG: hypothetical protein GY708_12225 [Actinomycetia bacterium]|nr:hypothetical protein [Actinomycetes bacterium]MCP4958354.1 hypothetical protein [Actinomycetes bacterium]